MLPPLTDDGDPAVRRRASVAAVRLGRDGPAATGAFARLLSDPDRRGGATGSPPPDGGRARARLTALTEDRSSRLRHAATRLLGTPDSGPP
ncbi:hypothetical protein AB0K53_17805 [Streptomyces tuirus]|uniref:hypothetical protein n=1 Tax=Streptomyces tuirus TaxID=68278 RepID=UPI003424FDD1